MYRFSEENLLTLVRAKVAKLAEPTLFSTFRSLARGLARTGLAEMLDDPSADEEKKREAEALMMCACLLRCHAPALVLSVCSLDQDGIAARVKASCDVLSQYLPPHISAKLMASYE